MTKATFSFYRTNDSGGYSRSAVFNICLINKDWESSSATWDNLASSFDSEIIATQNYTSGSGEWFDFDVTDAVSNMVANPSTNFGFMGFAVCDVPTNTTGHIAIINSSESPSEDLQPKVVVEYTGTPIVKEKVKINTAPVSITHNQAGNLVLSTRSEGKYSILFHTGNGRLIGRIDNKNLTVGSNTIYCGNLNMTKGLIVITLKNGGHTINLKAVIH